ncbi:hypothetical protein [Rubricoccus marinus]|uniref:hypothetical protein n=1 Tax=Rubricoccus marinus TaxID=716817 RepID=UPI00117A66BB|nr:hypothetical protein [Rubricoccus marinus]
MRSRLTPALLFAAAAVLYWLAAFPVLRFVLSDSPDSMCGGDCGVNIAFEDILGPLFASALAAAFVGSEYALLFARWFGHGVELGIAVTVASGVIGALGLGMWIAGTTGTPPSPGSLFGLLMLALPFAITAIPFGLAAEWTWRRISGTGSAQPLAPEASGAAQQ